MKAQLKDIVNLIRPQVGVNLHVRDYRTSVLVHTGPAHYLTGAESFCQKEIKEIAIVDGDYVVTIAS